MFRLDHETLRYGNRTVLADVSLTIAAGQRVALLGRSGAGKSTLLRTLYAQGAAEAALIPQDTALVQSLSVFHNVYMGRLHAGSTWYNLRNLVWPAARERAAMMPLLETLGLAELVRRPVGELSGGQRQRTAIARALHQQRRVLFGDEPVSAIDPHQARSIMQLMDVRHDTVVRVMHDIALALACSDRIIGLDGGRIALDAPAAQLDAAVLAPLYSGPVPPTAGAFGASPAVRPAREIC